MLNFVKLRQKMPSLRDFICTMTTSDYESRYNYIDRVLYYFSHPQSDAEIHQCNILAQINI